MYLSNLLLLLTLVLTTVKCVWPVSQAKEWYSKLPWGAGVNYTPAYAVNQIQMWTKFDIQAISKELQWANQLGFKYLRVFTHIYPYVNDKAQLYRNMFSFLTVCKGKGLKIIFVLLDDCWNPTYPLGPQQDPIPGIHNSRWAQSPGKMNYTTAQLQSYVQQTISMFKSTETVVMWDLYNEVGNSGKESESLPLLKQVFNWARTVNPSQPLTSGHWTDSSGFKTINEFILAESDVITFHAYCDVQCTEKSIRRFQNYSRPVICTQYMARALKSTFMSHLPLFQQYSTWAISWGFVFGRTQTYYPWWSKINDPVPTQWFHDVVHPDGTPFSQQEAQFIRNITQVSSETAPLVQST